jgi:hypothetical protein
MKMQPESTFLDESGREAGEKPYRIQGKTAAGKLLHPVIIWAPDKETANKIFSAAMRARGIELEGGPNE